MRLFFIICLIIFIAVPVVSQDDNEKVNNNYRGSIPEELFRPSRGESPRYPIDMIIGEMGRGDASEAAFTFAGSTAANLTAGIVSFPSWEKYILALEVINPESYRIGGGREETDGSVSFLIRFIGRDQGISGEMYVRYVTRQVEGTGGEIRTTGNWVLEDLFLEEPMDRDTENQEAMNRSYLNLYERFF